MTTTTVSGMRIQRDESGAGHRWRDVPSDSTEGGCREEIECWIIEERPLHGAEYVASNGMRYRVSAPAKRLGREIPDGARVRCVRRNDLPPSPENTIEGVATRITEHYITILSDDGEIIRRQRDSVSLASPRNDAPNLGTPGAQ